MEFTINAKQAIAILWTLVAIVLSLVVVITVNFPWFYGPWQLLVVLFFALLLVMTLPVYLFIALWQILSKSDSV